MIINSRSCANVTRTLFVQKLNLNTFKHKKVLVSFSVGKYKNEVLCNVLLIQAAHLLLGTS
jgi:hypothetical protein